MAVFLLRIITLIRFIDILLEYLIFSILYSIVQLYIPPFRNIYFSLQVAQSNKGDGNIINNAILKKLAEYHFRNGADRRQVAKKLNLSLPKLYKLMGGKQMVDEAEFLKPLTDYEVENALLRKAQGYVSSDSNKETAPDVSAAKTWLEFRCPEYWGGKNKKNSSDEKLDAILAYLNENMDEET